MFHKQYKIQTQLQLNTNRGLHPSALARGTVVRQLCCSEHGLSGHKAPEVRSSTLGPGNLSVYAGQLNAYSENDISGKHRRFDSVLFNL